MCPGPMWAWFSQSDSTYWMEDKKISFVSVGTWKMYMNSSESADQRFAFLETTKFSACSK